MERGHGDATRWFRRAFCDAVHRRCWVTDRPINSAELSVRAEEAGLDDWPGDTAVWRPELDGRRCRTARQFLLNVATVLDFPEYYGRNWDAFDECFGDLLEVTEGGMGYEFGGRAGRSEGRLHLVVRHAEDLLVDAEPRDFSLPLRLLGTPYPKYDPPQPWHRYVELRVTFLCALDALESFIPRYRAAEEGAKHLW